MAVPVAAIALGAVAAYKGIKGAVQNKKAKRLKQQAERERPSYRTQKAIRDNQAIMESRAGQGFSDKALRIQEAAVDSGLAVGIDGVLRSGGNVNHIGDLYGNYLEGTNKLALMDEEMRVRNLAAMVDQNYFMGSEQDKEWQMNKWNPFADKVQAAAVLKAQGNANINGALDTAAAAVGSFGGSIGGQKINDGPETPAYTKMNIQSGRAAGPVSTESVAATLQGKYPGLTGAMLGPKNSSVGQ